tara:strand:- start:2189 stop:3097 length:909 start_codon:yes stop_codon:yes gene_type:complete
MKKYKKKIIITGALGQDGIILSKLFIKNKFQVFGFVKKIKKYRFKNVKYLKTSLTNFHTLSKKIKYINPDIFIHLGTDNPNFLETKKKYSNKKNFKITKNIIDFFSINKVKTKIILIGSSQMYKKNSLKINVNTNFKPQNSYAKFRIKSHKYMMKCKKRFNLNATTAILFNHDSIFRNKKFLMPRIAKFIRESKYNLLNKIFLENISGDFSHAEDICKGIYKLALSKKNPDKLIFSSNKRTFINDIINYLLNLSNIKIKFSKIKKKKYLSPLGDNSLTRKELNWSLKKNIFIAAKELIKTNI